MDIVKFKKLPILGILRGIEVDTLEPLVESIISSGLKTIEITMNTNLATDLIRKAIRKASGRLCIGAGTVLSLDSLREALDAGATFIVTPVLVNEVMDYCLKHNVIVFAGAFSPQEIYNAWNAGAAMVKVFPAKFFGPDYFKEIKAPFNNIELLACGGVTPENTKDFFNAGASAVSFGASVFRQDWLKKRDFDSMASLIKKYLELIPQKTEYKA